MEELILLYYLKVFSFFISLLTIIFLYSFYLINKNIYINKNIINIEEGATIENIIDDYFKVNNLLQKNIFKFYYRIHRLNNSKIIHYGDFYVNNNISYNNFLKKISKPSNILNKLTIVEGWSKDDLNKELSKYFKDFKNIEYNEILADTYYFEKNKKFEVFYNKLINFKKNYFKSVKSKNSIINLKDNEIMIMGSLIEKEGLDYNDKRNISSVIFNRIKQNMKLQIDATVLYAVTNGRYDLNRDLNYNDLKIDHPFNTYKNSGLPPKPIAYVGTNTIDIIFENFSTDYLFYFFNNSLKKHVFSKNFEDHKSRLNEYRNSK